jgi:hypothetical protein
MRGRRAEILLMLSVLVGLAIMTIAVVTVVKQGESISSLIAQRHADQVQKNEENAEHSKNASINRAVNVEAWCEGNTPRSASLNGIVRYDGRFVLTVTGGKLRYTLHPNDCEQIVKETLASSTHRTKITAKSHPLVYRALHPKEG